MAALVVGAVLLSDAPAWVAIVVAAFCALLLASRYWWDHRHGRRWFQPSGSGRLRGKLDAAARQFRAAAVRGGEHPRAVVEDRDGVFPVRRPGSVDGDHRP